MAAPVVIEGAAKVALLLPRLASDKPGEVVATARAIGRQLAKHGQDWHDLAALLAADDSRDSPPAFSGEGRDPCWRMADDLLRMGALSDRERDFCLNMWRVLGRPGTEPTQKQRAWLVALWERGGHG